MKENVKKGKYANTASRRKARKKSKLIPILCVLLVFSALLFAGSLWLAIRKSKTASSFEALSAQVQSAAEPTVEKPAATIPTKPQTAASEQSQPEEAETQPPQTLATEPEELAILPQYEALYQQNTDLFGWVTIPDTAIDYPVMHTPDEPERYLHADFEGKYSYGGVPFIDAHCNPDSDNLLIYGHNMLDGSMFRSLMKYQEKNYWQEHPVIIFNTLYEQQEYEVLAAFYDRVYYKTETVFKFYKFIDAADEADYDYAISQFKEKSLYDTGVEAQYGDKLITLVTCAYHTNNGRFVVVARQK